MPPLVEPPLVKLWLDETTTPAIMRIAAPTRIGARRSLRIGWRSAVVLWGGGGCSRRGLAGVRKGLGGG